MQQIVKKRRLHLYGKDLLLVVLPGCCIIASTTETLP